MTIKDALQWGKNELKKNKVSEPEASGLVLLGDVLGMSRAEILANPEKGFSLFEWVRFRKYIKRRKNHESVWHIIGYKVFWGLPINVTSDVLVPRPETEMLVELVVNHVLGLGRSTTSSQKPLKILDMGTGSGAIALALANEFPDAKITAVDVSTKAIRLARKNAKNLGVDSVIKFFKSDLFENIDDKFDIITANLPYVPSANMASLPPEVLGFDPAIALDGGPDGLEVFERFLSEAGDYICEGGYIACEIGKDQGICLKSLVKKYSPRGKCDILKDFAGIDRIGIIKIANK